MPSSSDFIVPFPGPGPEPVTLDGWYPSADPSILTYFFWRSGRLMEGASVPRADLGAFIEACDREVRS